MGAQQCCSPACCSGLLGGSQHHGSRSRRRLGCQQQSGSHHLGRMGRPACCNNTPACSRRLGLPCSCRGGYSSSRGMGPASCCRLGVRRISCSTSQNHSGRRLLCRHAQSESTESSSGGGACQGCAPLSRALPSSTCTCNVLPSSSSASPCGDRSHSRSSRARGASQQQQLERGGGCQPARTPARLPGLQGPWGYKQPLWLGQRASSSGTGASSSRSSTHKQPGTGLGHCSAWGDCRGGTPCQQLRSCCSWGGCTCCRSCSRTWRHVQRAWWGCGRRRGRWGVQALPAVCSCHWWGRSSQQ